VLKVLFFARVREQLDCTGLELPWQPAFCELDALQEHLCQKGAHWRDVLSQENIIRAVNHCVVDSSCVLTDGDEVAFYPPVTGG